MMCAYWVRSSPGCSTPAGQCRMKGSVQPPRNTSRFQRRNGVLPAIAQPHG